MVSDETLDAIESAIKKAAKQSDAAQQDAQKSLHFSQAALNLTHAKVQLEDLKTRSNTSKK